MITRLTTIYKLLILELHAFHGACVAGKRRGCVYAARAAATKLQQQISRCNSGLIIYKGDVQAIKRH
jgi:hypothetical protein